MDYHKLINRYKQFGGLRLVREYARLGLLWPIAKAFVRCVVKRESFKRIYPVVLKRVEPYLRKRYYSCLQDRKNYYGGLTLDHHRSKTVWFCWLQGLENAPEIVKVCHDSLRKHLADRDIKVIDSKNWKDYVTLPEHVVRKWEQGKIPAANFSDLLRLELLIRYGGTWIDSTVLCTGFQDSGSMFQDSSFILSHTKDRFQGYFDADLFLFQYTQPGTTVGISISSWFITSHSNNVVLMIVRDMMFAYWKDYDCLIDYYLIHLFFEMVAREYPETVGAMPYGYSMDSLVLLHHWGEAFNQKKWDRLTKHVCFHKLSFRVNDKIKKDKKNFYNWILNVNK